MSGRHWAHWLGPRKISLLLGQQAMVFPSHHGGFLGGEFGYAGLMGRRRRRVRQVLVNGTPKAIDRPRITRVG
ncbi:hypothetical protein GCM10009609_44090 [Pseudonocardia aurantiaca]